MDSTTFIEKILMKSQKTITDRLHKMCLLPLLWLRRALSLVPVPLSFLLLVPPFLHAQEGNPRHPGIVGFEKIARLPLPSWPLGDINEDGIDDIISERYLDTCFRSWQCAQERRIHYGVKGGLPNLEEGFRVGPNELMTKTSILAIGDWDAKNGKDLCALIEFYTDTSYGNIDLKYSVFRTVVFWNDGTGRFSLEDTTRIWPGSFEAGNVVTKGTSIDLDHNGVEDLFLSGDSYILIGGKLQRNAVPRMRVYLGSTDKPLSNTPDWSWWNAPENTSRLEAQDLDHDGAQDLIFYNDGYSAPLTVLYGRSDGELPDTISDMQQIDTRDVRGVLTDFSDVTGDAYSDLVVLNYDEDLVYIYASTPSTRRLEEMFGTGNDPPREGEWWSRPWAALKGPRLVNQYWFGLERHLFPIGSADTSCPDEIWVMSWPFLLVYRTGTRLDSLIDAELDLRVAGGVPTRIGDIDGDGRDEFAMVASGTTIFRFPDELPRPVRRLRRVPDGTGKPTSGVEESTGRESKTLGVEVVPNPSSGEVTIEWGIGSHGGATSQQLTIRITDILGQEVLSEEVPLHRGEYLWDASNLPNGIYYVMLRVDEVTETKHIRIQQ